MRTYLPATEVARRTLQMQDERRYPIAAIWRARSFEQTAGQPMTMRRALALNAVLDNSERPMIPGELLLGSGLGRFAPEGDPQALEWARPLLAETGGRTFVTHADHAAPDYPALLRLGFGGLLAQVQARLAEEGEHPFLASVVVALEGAQRHVMRWAEAAECAAEAGGTYAALLREQATDLRAVAAGPPRTFRQALQLVFLTHGMWQLDDRYAMALGRLDQYLYPFYMADLAAGRLSAEEAQDLLDHLFAKLAHRGDIQNVCVGGQDREGRDATNDLSYMCVEAARRIGQPGGNLTARIHPGTPDAFLRKCAECIRTGIGFPAVYNDTVQVPALAAQGYPPEDARDYCFVGCIEAFIPGRQAPWADSRFNLLRCVDLALRGGRDGLTGETAGPETGTPETWEAFYVAFLAQMRAGLWAHTEGLNNLEREAQARAADLTSPLLSALTADCIARGRDLCDGGATYPANHGVAGMGIGSTADALTAVKRFVYEERRFSLEELRRMLDADFAGYERDRLLLLRGAPKYGNDEPEVDALATEVARAFGEELLQYRLPGGGRYWGLMAANISNIYAGREVGATPDGRHAREPLSDAASPSFGRDTHGPTAAASSVARLDYRLAPGGNVVNMKLHHSALAGEEGLAALAALIRGCFAQGGVQLQFNTTDRAVLRDAMEHPENHAGLVVRVSGFSAYFTALERAVQEDILARTEHTFA